MLLVSSDVSQSQTTQTHTATLHTYSTGCAYTPAKHSSY